VKLFLWDEDTGVRTEGGAESGFMTQVEGYNSEFAFNLRF
jgi:hypothetical protein